MMDPGPAGGGRGGKRRRRSNGGGSSAERGRSGGTNKRRRRRRDNRHKKGSSQDALPPVGGDESSILGGRTPRERNKTRTVDGPPNAFELFCAYYLGITPDDGYQKPNIEEIARRHSMTADGIRELLVEFDLEPNTVRSTFNLEDALLDIRLAPAGISRTEIARDFYDEYVAARASNS